ncbi:MAG: hypothetical protein K1000chlam2_01534 [Chlamydiae bacterium]|nr:hypothetical protein [Chlamydiota bacterium]
MADVATFRKNKIELKEYDYSKDIQNRVLMSQFSLLDFEVLEEILYSSLRIPLSILEKNLDISNDQLVSILEKLSKTQLFKVVADHVLVDKEMRKYYELQILKFEEDFKPGMEYLQGLLKKVPIHILPIWYSISRTSNNIFESIVEKHLETPQIFQRYLMELNLTDPIQKGIMNAVYQSPDYCVNAADMIKKFNLTQEALEEHMLHLEFSFVCCVRYVREKKGFKEVITPFHEWCEYLCHVRDTEPASIIDEEKIDRIKSNDFAATEEMALMLELAQKKPITAAAIGTLQKKCSEFNERDFESYAEKLCTINLADRDGEKLVCTSDALEWLKMKPYDRAIYLYRHPLNGIDSPNLPEELCEPRIVREAEKSVSRIVNSGWVFLEDFLKGIFIPLKESHIVSLVRQGRSWKYQLPHYTESELNFFKTVIKNWLFEAGITAWGTKDGRECFCLTSLGQELFSDE